MRLLWIELAQQETGLFGMHMCYQFGLWFTRDLWSVLGAIYGVLHALLRASNFRA